MNKLLRRAMRQILAVILLVALQLLAGVLDVELTPIVEVNVQVTVEQSVNVNGENNDVNAFDSAE